MRGISLRDVLTCLGTRDEIERLVEALIEALDELDGDADLEPSLGSLGNAAPSFDQRRWAEGGRLDLEEAFDGEPFE